MGRMMKEGGGANLSPALKAGLGDQPTPAMWHRRAGYNDDPKGQGPIPAAGSMTSTRSLRTTSRAAPLGWIMTGLAHQ
jgi:hypothetical protein